MTQGFISNDKCSDANLTDMVPLYLSPIYLDESVPLLIIIIIVIVIKIFLRRGYFEFVTYGAAAYAIAGYWTGELKNVDRWTEVKIMMMLRAKTSMINILIMLVVIMIIFLKIVLKTIILGGRLADDGELSVQKPQVRFLSPQASCISVVLF